MGAFQDVLVALALSGLTGIRAFLPLFIVSFGKKLFGKSFPICLSTEGALLDSWLVIAALGGLCLMEILSDCIPVVAEMEDVVMDFVKPIVGMFIAFLPAYSPQDGDPVGAFDIGVGVMNAGVSFAVGVTKQLGTVLVDAGSVGIGTPIRSGGEDLLVFALTFGMIAFASIAGVIAVFVLILSALAFAYFCFWACKKKARKIRASRKEKRASKKASEDKEKKGPKTDPVDSEDESEEESDEEEGITCVCCNVFRRINKMRKKASSRRIASARSMGALAGADAMEPLL